MLTISRPNELSSNYQVIIKRKGFGPVLTFALNGNLHCAFFLFRFRQGSNPNVSIAYPYTVFIHYIHTRSYS